MNEDTYLHLLSLVTPLIKRQDTILRNAITPHERLTATLRFLATGRSYECLKFSTIISPQALSAIIPETCEAIYKVLHKDYLKVRNKKTHVLFIYFLFKSSCEILSSNYKFQLLFNVNRDTYDPAVSSVQSGIDSWTVVSPIAFIACVS